MKTRYLMPVALLAGIVLMGQGCNPFARFEAQIQENIGNSITEGLIESSVGGDADVEIGSNAKIPENYPSDVPQYPDAKYISAVVMKEGSQSIANFQTEHSADAVLKWYDEELKSNGFELDTEIAMGGALRIYEKGDVKITVQVASSPADGYTTVSVQRVQN